jgi:hypothetical protein
MVDRKFPCAMDRSSGLTAYEQENIGATHNDSIVMRLNVSFMTLDGFSETYNFFESSLQSFCITPRHTNNRYNGPDNRFICRRRACSGRPCAKP